MNDCNLRLDICGLKFSWHQIEMSETQNKSWCKIVRKARSVRKFYSPVAISEIYKLLKLSDLSGIEVVRKLSGIALRVRVPLSVFYLVTKWGKLPR